jgi:small subunit ribosomal protein S7
MPRKKAITTYKEVFDPKYMSPVVGKFVTRMMLDGKKAQSNRILNDAFNVLAEKTGKEPLEVFLKALDNVKPLVEVKSRRVGGSTYQVPVEIRETRREALAMRWIIKAARDRKGNTMSSNLSTELLDAYNSTGTAFKKKEDTHRMAEANKAFSHYRW